VRHHTDVGDRVQIRSDGGSAAARKYAGKTGQVTMRGPGLDRVVVDVQIEDNTFDTVFEEQDLSPTTERER
jgi:ribosomal protein L21E